MTSLMLRTGAITEDSAPKESVHAIDSKTSQIDNISCFLGPLRLCVFNKLFENTTTGDLKHRDAKDAEKSNKSKPTGNSVALQLALRLLILFPNIAIYQHITLKAHVVQSGFPGERRLPEPDQE